jgi:transcriptional regulator GlxA family with amidase domain
VSIKYATQLKMDIAKQLHEVAFETGYHDVRHFSRQDIGLSPTRYHERGGLHLTFKPAGPFAGTVMIPAFKS